MTRLKLTIWAAVFIAVFNAVQADAAYYPSGLGAFQTPTTQIVDVPGVTNSTAGQGAGADTATG